VIVEKMISNEFEEFALIHGRRFEHFGMGGGHGEKNKSLERNGARKQRKKVQW
jgi:hypothetical protein